jgi:two-component system alkaline phosphatase synthesis response regulator PhoP
MPQDAVTETLRGMRFAIVGFGPEETSRIRSALDMAGSRANCVADVPAHPRLHSLAMYDACVSNVSAAASGETPADLVAQKEKPAILIGDNGEMRRLAAMIASPMREFLLRPWTEEELVLRAFRVLRYEERRNDARIAVASRHEPLVVLADDDKMTEVLVSSMLKSNAMDCKVVSDGNEALALVRKLKPDILLLDISMPKMDGFQVLTALKDDPSTGDVHVVMLTASNAEDDLVRGFSLGAEDYIVKPFHPHEMVARLKRLLRRREAA